MKPGFLFIVMAVFFGTVFNSCSKEYSCEHCLAGNKPPIADAGIDQLVILPKDSTTITGKASKDPDGFIVSFKWRTLSPNPSLIITHPDSAVTMLRGMIAGVYDLELKVTDNEGLSSADTMQIRVSISSQINQPPVAKAGADITYTQPINSVSIDGSQSYDPDGTIVSYVWKQIAGANQTNITDPMKANSKVYDVTGGTYLFELTVTDNAGLSSSDTVQVSATLNPTCLSNRPIFNAQLVPFGILTAGRMGMLTATAGNKILFIGGFTYDEYALLKISSRVDIYDYMTNTWSYIDLSIPRQDMSVATAGNKIYIAGGFGSGINHSMIDIYDATNDSWTKAELSEPRGNICSVTMGDKIFFAGGNKWIFNHYEPSNRIDILNTTTGTWTMDSLSEARASAVGTTINNKIYFAGGKTKDNNISNRIDIYDGVSNSWSVSSLQEGKLFFASAVDKKNIYWAGGVTGIISTSAVQSLLVEIRDVETQTSSFSCLSNPIAGLNSVLFGENIIFFPGFPSWNVDVKTFDVFNLVSKSWSIGKLNYIVPNASIISVNNNIYVAGGNQSNIMTTPEVFLLKW
jgi:N-acetylneuraminic acid mutarotase